MTRKRWVYIDGKAVEVGADFIQDPKGPMIFGDLPSYHSPVTGKWVDGRAARREDLKRTGCRPYEGREQELKEILRQQAYADQKLDASLTKTASEAFYQLPPEKRRILTQRS